MWWRLMWSPWKPGSTRYIVVDFCVICDDSSDFDILSILDVLEDRKMHSSSDHLCVRIFSNVSNNCTQSGSNVLI